MKSVFGVISKPKESDDGEEWLYAGIARTRDEVIQLKVDDGSQEGLGKKLKRLTLSWGIDSEHCVVNLMGKGWQKREITIWGSGGARVKVSDLTQLIRGDETAINSFVIRERMGLS